MTGRTLRLLVVDRSEADTRDALDALRAVGFLPMARRLDDAAALAALLKGATPPADARPVEFREEAFDAVLCALQGDGHDGLAALAIFRAAGHDRPFLFVAEAVGEELAVAAIKAGAHDVVLRRHLSKLAPALERELAAADDRARRRATRDELQRTRDRYVDLYESAPVGYLTLGGDGSLLQVNRTALDLLGQPADAITGVRFSRFVLRPDVERWQQHLERVVAGDERRRVEVRLRAAHGAIIHVQADSVRVPGGGAFPRVRVALTDISDRKEAEASLRRFEAKLREVQKMESLGTLAGGIAHDFNNILAAILGNVQLARDDLPDEHRAVVSLEEIRKASLRARDLVSQILMFSRREPQELVTQPLQPILEETWRLLRATLPARVDLEFDLPGEPLHAHADATQLQQVVMNLCTNAWHALKDGAGHIHVSLRPVVLEAADARRLGLDGPGDYAQLDVSDDGMGMDALTQARIFEPFFTTKPVGQGTGLGLSVVHGILAAHRGAVDVASAPGQGTTFRLWFPRVPAPRPMAAASPGHVPRLAGDGERIAYIDDDETMVVMVERLLARAGYRVSAYTDPARALADLCGGGLEVDCVVTDFNMPEISGLDIARRLRDACPGLPVVISTGYLSDELRSDARQLGVRALLQKQNTVQELGDLVGHVLAGSVAG